MVSGCMVQGCGQWLHGRGSRSLVSGCMVEVQGQWAVAAW